MSEQTRNDVTLVAEVEAIIEGHAWESAYHSREFSRRKLTEFADALARAGLLTTVKPGTRRGHEDDLADAWTEQ